MTKKIGLIGVGAIAQAYISALEGSDFARIHAISDVRSDILDTATESIGCQGYPTYEELAEYSGCDAVIVCTPPSTHPEIACHFLERGTPVLPMLGAANHAPRAFEKPDAFDVARSPNHHLGFGFGSHFCLGRQLALMETRIALRNLFERFPDLHLAVEPGELQLARLPGWHRYQSLPVALH